MNATDFLLWVRGPGLTLAAAIFFFGLALRFIEIYGLGRRADLAVPRDPSPGSGWRTIVARSLPPPGMVKRAPVTYIGGYVFHLGLALILFFFVPHIEAFKGVFGLSWPGLPTPLIDFATVAAIVALFALLAHRIADPVKRLISGPGDYVVWALTLLPLLTGYLAARHMVLEYTWMLGLHILSAEILFAALPFTKLFHAFSLFVSRFYTGQIFGRKGVAL